MNQVEFVLQTSLDFHNGQPVKRLAAIAVQVVEPNISHWSPIVTAKVAVILVHAEAGRGQGGNVVTVH